jgi:hypothetical protein
MIIPDNAKISKEKCKVGLDIFSFVFGHGTIIEINFDNNYPILVVFGGTYESYTEDGKYYHYHPFPSIFLVEPIIVFPEEKIEGEITCLQEDDN